MLDILHVFSGVCEPSRVDVYFLVLKEAADFGADHSEAGLDQNAGQTTYGLH
jgi:hypothetical protein